MLKKIDHLIYAAPNLKEAIEKAEDLLKVKASPGGRHPVYGTANVLISLGSETYLEIIGPDPRIEFSELPPLFSIDKLTAPKLVTWAAKEPDLEHRLALLHENQIPFGEIYPGQRAKPDGTVLSWHFTNPLHVVGDGVIPFLIDWGKTVNPAKTSTQGCQLLGLELEHPQAIALQPIIDALDLKMEIKKGPIPAMMATIHTPLGEVVLS